MRKHPKCSYCDAEADHDVKFGGSDLTGRLFACGKHYDQAHAVASGFPRVESAFLRIITREELEAALSGYGA